MAVHSDISVRFKPVPQGPEGFDEIDSAGPYTTQQNQFMELVKSQDVFEVRKFIISNENFDVNENNVGRAALRFAIDYNDLKMIDFLVKETSLKVGGSLFTAVREGSKDCVEKLMRPPSRTGATPQDEGYIGPEDVDQELLHESANACSSLGGTRDCGALRFLWLQNPRAQHR